MSQNDSPASIQACALRFSRCTSTGAIATGANNGYCTNQFAKLTFKPELENGVEFTIRNACGSLVTTYKDRDVVKRYSFDLELQVPDPELHELFTGASIILSGGVTIGHQAPPLGINPQSYNYGVAGEAWTKAIVGTTQVASLPWFHWVFPLMYFNPGEKNAENADMKVTFSGYFVENPQFGTGPWTTNPVTGLTYPRAYAVFRDSTLPSQQAGYISTPF
jgi:hypothetical protein